MKYYTNGTYFFKVINDKKMLGVMDSILNPNIDVYNEGNIYGEHSLLKDCKECSKNKFDGIFDKVVKRLFELKDQVNVEENQ